MKKGKCPACEMEQEDWPNRKGVTVKGKTYCCQGCADGSGCTCEEGDADADEDEH